MVERVHQPTVNNYPGTVVLAPRPLGGTQANTDERLAMVANVAGVEIAGLQMAGTGHRSFFDLASGRMSPARFRMTCSLDTRKIIPFMGCYDRVVGWGDSRAGLNSMYAQLDTEGFAALLLRDAFNVHPGGWNRTLDFIRHTRQQKPLEQTLPDDLPPPTYATTGIFVNTVIEALAYRKQLAGTATMQAGIDIASNTDTPLHIVTLSDSFSGDPAVAENFIETLRRLRSENTSGSEIVTTPVIGSHNLLMAPRLAAGHLATTLAMVS